MYKLMNAENTGARLLKLPAACQYTSMGRNKFLKWADEVGCVKRYGGSVFYDKLIIDRAIDQMTTKTE